jgi:hypothetical protein
LFAYFLTFNNQKYRGAKNLKMIFVRKMLDNRQHHSHGAYVKACCWLATNVFYRNASRIAKPRSGADMQHGFVQGVSMPLNICYSSCKNKK